MTDQEKTRLEELRAKEELTEEEDGELLRLIALDNETKGESVEEVEEEKEDGESETNS